MKVKQCTEFCELMGCLGNPYYKSLYDHRKGILIKNRNAGLVKHNDKYYCAFLKTVFVPTRLCTYLTYEGTLTSALDGYPSLKLKAVCFLITKLKKYDLEIKTSKTFGIQERFIDYQQ